jgi:hypothetical protein
VEGKVSDGFEGAEVGNGEDAVPTSSSVFGDDGMLLHTGNFSKTLLATGAFTVYPIGTSLRAIGSYHP